MIWFFASLSKAESWARALIDVHSLTCIHRSAFIDVHSLTCEGSHLCWVHTNEIVISINGDASCIHHDPLSVFDDWNTTKESYGTPYGQLQLLTDWHSDDCKIFVIVQHPLKRRRKRKNEHHSNFMASWLSLTKCFFLRAIFVPNWSWLTIREQAKWLCGILVIVRRWAIETASSMEVLGRLSDLPSKREKPRDFPQTLSTKLASYDH